MNECLFLFQMSHRIKIYFNTPNVFFIILWTSFVRLHEHTTVPHAQGGEGNFPLNFPIVTFYWPLKIPYLWNACIIIVVWRQHQPFQKCSPGFPWFFFITLFFLSHWSHPKICLNNSWKVDYLQISSNFQWNILQYLFSGYFESCQVMPLR